jgi:hypothetical protein
MQLSVLFRAQKEEQPFLTIFRFSLEHTTGSAEIVSVSRKQRHQARQIVARHGRKASGSEPKGKCRVS